MENSFFEYRDKTGVECDSDTEVIDNSAVEDSFVSLKKTPKLKNQTVFVAESEESTEDESEEVKEVRAFKSVSRRSSAAQPHIIFSSDDDESSKRGSIRRQSDNSPNKVVVSSSDEGDVSPEIVPRRRPPPKSSVRSSDSFIGKKTKKRMFLIDSDTENSIIIEHDKHKKLLCLKETPIKIVNDKKADVSNMSYQNDSEEDDESEDSENDDSPEDKEIDDIAHETSKTLHRKDEDDDELAIEADKNEASKPFNEDRDSKEMKEDSKDNSEVEDSEDDETRDEDEMVMSRATRMSIMGVIPKDNDSDDSDFIQSDDTTHTSRASSALSHAELPDSEIHETKSPLKDTDTSRLTCSPFASPLKDVTNEFNNSINDVNNASIQRSKTNKNDAFKSSLNKSNLEPVAILDLTQMEPCDMKPKNLNKTLAEKERYKENFIDDDVTIIDTKPEIIALSSDDEDEIKVDKSPNMNKSLQPKEESKRVDGDIKQYLMPPSYPNQVVYVKKHVRENELSKLNGLKEDLQNIRYLLENMDVDTLPDGGVKLIERLTALEADVRRQGDKVANMLVEPDEPTAQDIANDGFGGKEEKRLSWDDIQKASIAVQPRMFGKQAMATHMAERNLILERLRDLHESLASRPPEHEQTQAPAALRSPLMPHQLHALAWLQWRETQRPAGGVLADDMGLGKTITMISLIASDKERAIDNDDDDDDHRANSRLARGGTLVVCPASLMQQWAGEVSKHCSPHALSVTLHHGAARAAHPHRLAAHDLVLTTYNLLQREHEKNGVLTKVQWRRVILDEAHAVRNHKSATSAAVCAVKAPRRWALTGTPLHNRDLDLFALLKFLHCSPFDDLTMWKKWIDNKSLGGQERLNTIMRCIMLRRTKVQLQHRGQLACLPPRDTHQIHVTLDKEEMNVYQKVLVFSKTLFAQFLHQRAEKHADSLGPPLSEKDSAYHKMHKKMIALQGAKPVKSHEILVLLLRLRQVCCHCGLIAAMLDSSAPDDVHEDLAGQDLLAELNKLSLEDSKSRRKSGKQDEEEKDEVDGPEDSTTVAEAIRSVLSPNNPVFGLDKLSSKIAAVMECLNKNVLSKKGEKAVVVSQWTSVLRLVGKQLTASRVRSVTLDGSVPVTARPALVTALNDPQSDARVMLLSLMAGGVGLNLCGANHLLLLDPHWNPQLEEQAADRIYRVGQTKHVHVYRFMCVDTVEQSIRKLQAAKLELADNVLTGAKNTAASKLSIEDLKVLFNMGTQ